MTTYRAAEMRAEEGIKKAWKRGQCQQEPLAPMTHFLKEWGYYIAIKLFFSVLQTASKW